MLEANQNVGVGRLEYSDVCRRWTRLRDSKLTLWFNVRFRMRYVSEYM
jgi:hypothetical protein